MKFCSSQQHTRRLRTSPYTRFNPPKIPSNHKLWGTMGAKSHQLAPWSFVGCKLSGFLPRGCPPPGNCTLWPSKPGRSPHLRPGALGGLQVSKVSGCVTRISPFSDVGAVRGPRGKSKEASFVLLGLPPSAMEFWGENFEAHPS